MSFLTESIHIRLTKEGASVVTELRDKYPDEYKTKSDVLRAGVFALQRWKKKDLEIQEESKKCTT